MDERDVIFGRANYKEGNYDYNDYYTMRPEKKEIDDYLRSLPKIGDKENKWYDPLMHPFIDIGFKMISEMEVIDNETASSDIDRVTLQELTDFIKEIISKMGGRAKIVKASTDLFYDYKGRPATKYGKEVDKSYKNIIVFSMPMDLEYINKSPLPQEMLSTIIQYMQGATISIWLSKYLNSLNQRSKAQFDGNYDVVLPLVAIRAGLGQIGKHGILIDEYYGPRIRLAAILTDADLIEDEVKVMPIQDVCDECNMCIDSCLAQAIRKEPINSQTIEHEKCYERWRIYGSDCAVCIKVCPFAQEIYQKYYGKLNSKENITKFIDEHKETIKK